MSEQKEHKNYELMVALKSLLPDDLRKELHKDIVGFVGKFGGKVLDVDVWGKRYLAYKIGGHNEGYYIVYEFEIAPENISELKRYLQSKQEILRFMITGVENVDKIGKSIKKKELEI